MTDQQNTINVYSDPAFTPPGTDHPVFLSQFSAFGPAKMSASPRFKEYLANPDPAFRLTSLAEAHFAVLPVVWEDIEHSPEQQTQAQQFVAHVSAHQKKTVILYRGDSVSPIDIPDTVVFRTSLLRSAQLPHESAMPAIVEDFVNRYMEGHMQIRYKRDRARVGFCGTSFFPNTLKDRIRKVAVTAGMRESKPTVPREHALKTILNSKHIDANFVLRDRSWWTDDWEQKVIWRREYVQNILDSDYTLAVRGVGNFSWRFYETLSCGRIPIFVNTDSVLPFEDELDWKQFCIWIEEAELPHIDEKIADFHNEISRDHFIEMQRQNRKLWLDWLSAGGFYAHFYQHPLLMGNPQPR